MLKVSIQPFLENEQCRIGVQARGFDPDFPGLMKTIPGAYWNPETRHWLIAYQKDSFARLKALFGAENIEVLPDALSSESIEAVPESAPPPEDRLRI